VPLAALHGVPLAPVQLVVPVDQVPVVDPERLHVSVAADATPGATAAASTSPRRNRLREMLRLIVVIPLLHRTPSLVVCPERLGESAHFDTAFSRDFNRRSRLVRGGFVPAHARFVPFSLIRPSRAADSSQTAPVVLSKSALR
jgi:hypothetical protein